MGRGRFPELVFIAQKYLHSVVKLVGGYHDDSADLVTNKMLKKIQKENADEDNAER